jgi:thioesterase domain-containing protein
LFCVHPAGGTVLCYLELARNLDGDLPVYGLQAQGLDGIATPLESVAAMAAAYIAAMKSVQPAGPYQVCGWSTGGIIAFEIARQLTAAAEEVPVVVLFDSAIPRDGEAFDEKDLVSLLGMLFPDEDLSGIQELDRQQQLEAFQARAERAQLLFAGAPTSQVARIYDVLQAGMKAVSEYRPGPLRTPLTIIRAAGQATPMHADPLLGWEPWANAGAVVEDVTCTHLEMFQQPGIRQVAAILNRCLNREALERGMPPGAAAALRNRRNRPEFTSSQAR